MRLVTKARRRQPWLSMHGIPLFYHPPNSPDLSPLNCLARAKEDHTFTTTHPPSFVHDLKSAVSAAWGRLDVADINKHILSMPNRVTAILQGSWWTYSLLILHIGTLVLRVSVYQISKILDMFRVFARLECLRSLSK